MVDRRAGERVGGRSNCAAETGLERMQMKAKVMGARWSEVG